MAREKGRHRERERKWQPPNQEALTERFQFHRAGWTNTARDLLIYGGHGTFQRIIIRIIDETLSHHTGSPPPNEHTNAGGQATNLDMRF